MRMQIESVQSSDNLIANLAEFVSLLRHEGLPVGTTELFDVLQALSCVNISNRSHFKAALRASLAKNQRDQGAFDRAFSAFFLSGEMHSQRAEQADSRLEALKSKIELAERDMQFKGEPLSLSRAELEQFSMLSREERQGLLDFVQQTEEGKNVESRFKPLLETVVKSHLRYCRSREDNLARQQNKSAPGAGAAGGAAGEAVPASQHLREIDIEQIKTGDLPAAEQLLQRLSRKLAVKILRRRRSGPRSGALDLRRSLRDNMRFGGLIFNISYKPKRRSREQVALLCDLSASMKRYSTFVIHFLYGMQEAVSDLSCFGFSDHLEDLTGELKGGRDIKHLLDRVIRRSSTWGGGTDLGAALESLLDSYPERINQRTTLLVVSDTKTVQLRRALEGLKRVGDTVKRVIWLNPLPSERWSDYSSVEKVAALTEMWPAGTIGQLEEVLSGRLSEAL